jgi:hypothetical protein
MIPADQPGPIRTPITGIVPIRNTVLIPAHQHIKYNPNGYVYRMQQYLCRNRNLIIGIIACLLMAGIPTAMAADETTTPLPVGGTITVYSFPPGAAVFLNGEYRGVTPADFENVPPGDYLINVSLAGYNNESFPTTIFDGSRREIGVNLENASSASAAPSTAVTISGYGSIAIDSSPGGATIMLDGNNVGTTRMDGYAFNVNNVPSGSHTVSVELAGYPPYASTVTVIKNHVVQVNADFLSGTPTITGTPIATTAHPAPVPLSPLTAIAAAGLIGLAAVFRRS